MIIEKMHPIDWELIRLALELAFVLLNR